MARRGFFAELQHQSKVAARERERAERESSRAYVALVRQVEQAKKVEVRAQIDLAKSTEADRKRFEKEAREAHLSAMESSVLERNSKLEQVYEEIDLLLASTLEVDDYVDLDSLRVEVSHPRFEHTDLEASIPPPRLLPLPAEPVLALPAAPTGLAGLFGKRKFADAADRARQVHGDALVAWRQACQDVRVRSEAMEAAHVRDEARRLDSLRSERARYAKECVARDQAARESNKRLEELKANLSYGTVEAVQEYVAVVLSNSVYPEHFQVAHDFDFDPTTAELSMQVRVPGPSEIPDIKLYKYAKVTDEIITTLLSQKECRDRYARAVHQVALRSLHEVFEADRRGLIRTISLEVGTRTLDPATGQRTYIPFVVAGVERDAFLAFDLSAVVPALTLGRLGAAVSKNPHALVAAERAGVRRS